MKDKFSPDPNRVLLAEGLRLGAIIPKNATMVGEQLGTKTGASAEFMDHRPYIWGDDLRRVDWAAFARSDRLLIKRFREEIRPLVQIWIDDSASMQIEEGKAQMAVDLAAMIGRICDAEGLGTYFFDLGSGKWPAREPFFLQFQSVTPLMESIRKRVGSLPTGALVILISDFLSPHDAAELVSMIDSRAGGIVLLQVLGQSDIAPAEGGRMVLEDSESGEEIDIELGHEAITAYLKRLSFLQESLIEACIRVQGKMVSLCAEDDFAWQCREKLVQAGVLAVQGD